MAGNACRPATPARASGPGGVDAADAQPPLSLAEWADLAVAPLRPAAHHRLLLDALGEVEAGRGGRLVVLMPPGSAKSTYSSVVFPAWWMHRNPTANIVAASHTETLAHHFGRQVRGLVAEHADRLGLALARDDRAAGRWSVRPGAGGRGGDYFAAGVRGPITGRRADLVLIDDPIRSHAEAESAGSRESLWQWFQADLLPRLKPRGSVVLIMTRWHEDDLAGRLLSLNHSGLWRVLRLPALAEADDPLGREPGAALWPEWEDAEALAAKRGAVGERVWASLFQQSPRPDTGTLFRPERISVVDAVPACARVVRAWDLAATVATTGRDPDWTAGVKLGRTAGGALCVLDVVRLRGGPLDVERAILAAAAADGTDVAIGLPQDPGQAGKQQVAYLTGRLAGWRVVASPESGSKLTRAGPVSAQVEAGLASVVRGDWNRALVEELRDFPHGRKDDQVDALSRAFALLTNDGPAARRLHVPLLGR